MKDYEELRDFRRMAIDCVLEYRPVAGGNPILAQARDLSASGLAFACDRPPAEGEQLEVKIDSGSKLLHAIVEVVRVRHLNDGSHEVACRILSMQ